MASNGLIGTWATGFWETNLGSPPTISVLTISGYAVQPGTLGMLNTRIGTCYSGLSTGAGGVVYDASPDLGLDQLAIIGAAFEVSWYNRLAQTMMGLSPEGVSFTHIREGDESYTRANVVNIGKEYREMANDARARLDKLISAFNSNGTVGQVAFYNPPARAYSPYGPIGGVYGYGIGGGS